MNMDIYEDDFLMHIGMPRRSGRYPWGSGKDPHQHSSDFLSRIAELKKQGFTYTDENGKTWTGDNAIAKSMGLSSTQYRIEKALAKDERRMLVVARAKSLSEDGLGATEIGREMGLPESTVRSLLNEKSEARMQQAMKTADFIRTQIETKGMVDVGKGVERELGISKEKLNEALYILEREGYPVYKGGIPQPTNPGQQTNQRVICPKGTEHKEIYNYDKVHPLNEDQYVSHDGGETFDKFVYPKSMDSKRLKVRYAEEGGVERDGTVEIRRGVPDLDLGDSHYAQVRILVDKTHYIKGMAVYSDDLPPGVDIVFNTNKKQGTPALGPKDNTVLKNIKGDPDNPFGSLIKAEGQSYYIDANGKRQLSAINKTREQGDWSEWADTLPSQFLSKQSLTMAKKQLGLAKADKLAEYDEICSINNPTIKKHLLKEFANNCDAAAADLKAAALPGQKYHVIIPVNTLKDNEVYAPGYKPGSKVALIRYPHGGTFEIPILTVTDKNKLGDKWIGKQSMDAVGVNKKIADRLSGADFDGDTVMVIPTHDSGGKVKIKSTPPLKGLEGFDPKDAYGPETYKGRTVRIMKNTGTEMGKISNLITDMTLAGATQDELARAVRHSMVVIDAEKHRLNYKQSEIDNNISALKKKYQVKVNEDGTERYGGASTIISKSKGETSVLKRQGSPKVNQKGKEWYDPTRPEGALIYNVADDVAYTVKKVNKRTGEVTYTTKYKQQKSTNMAETDDAYTLVSKAKHPMELVYADYANSMKSLANQARMEVVRTKDTPYSASAKKTYQVEVTSLMDKLNTALLNTGRERAAIRMTNAEIAAKKAADPNMKAGDIKKASQQALTKNRKKVGAIARKNRNIDITDREWDAIQAGAISPSKLNDILANTDVDKLRQRATPRATTSLSSAKVQRIKSMNASNYSVSQIADALGVSTTTVTKYLKGEES